MFEKLKEFWRDENGVMVIEYAGIVAGLAAVIMTFTVAFSADMALILEGLSAYLQSAVADR